MNTPTPTLSKAYLSLSPIPKAFVLVLLLVVSAMAGFRLVVPIADYILSGIQWIFQYYPEDADPEFFLMWAIANLLFAVSMTAIILRSLGVRIPYVMQWVSVKYLLLVLFSFVISFGEYELYWWQ